MIVTGNQKEEYLKEYHDNVQDTLISYMNVDEKTAEEKAEKALADRRKALEEAMEKGVDVGGVVRHIVYPIDIVHASESEKIVDGYYYLVEEDGKEKLYRIRF